MIAIALLLVAWAVLVMAAKDSGQRVRRPTHQPESIDLAVAGDVPETTWEGSGDRPIVLAHVDPADPGVIDVIDTPQVTLVDSITRDPGVQTTAFDERLQRVSYSFPGCAVDVRTTFDGGQLDCRIR